MTGGRRAPARPRRPAAAIRRHRMSNSSAAGALYTPRTSRGHAATGPRDHRQFHRVHRPVLRHRPLPAAADDVRDRVDCAQRLWRSAWRWDPYPFILLNLAFSTQAAYAAPLILLAQNRQENRDRVTLDEDRRRASQTKADTEYLARELAALRLAIGEVARLVSTCATSWKTCGICCRIGPLKPRPGTEGGGDRTPRRRLNSG